jgi:hypothetical protein
MSCAGLKKGINFTIHNGRRIQVTPILYPLMMETFINDNASLWPLVTDLGVEIQMIAKFKELAQAFICMVKGRYPHINVRYISPSSVRAYFGTRILSGTNRYKRRKQASVDMLNSIMSRSDAIHFSQVFRPKLDDAIEAALMAIYMLYNPICPVTFPRGTLSKLPRKKGVQFKCTFEPSSRKRARNVDLC